jgi:hypothetical protein
MIKNLRAFEIKYISPTDTKGARVSINDLRHNKRKIIYFDYEENNIKDMANKYLKECGIICLYGCETKKSYIILTDNFNIMIK